MDGFCFRSNEVPNSGNTRQGDGVSIVISADGSQVISRGGAGSDDMLYRRLIDDFEPRGIEGTTSGRNPFFSPDNRWIGFLSATYFKKVRANGGPSITIGKAPASPDGVHWGEDGYIYYGQQGRIWRISVEDGKSEPLTGGDPEKSLRLAMPFVLVTVNAGLQQFDRNQEMVARSLGASRLKAFLTVTLPQIRNSVVAGALFAFIVSFDEVVIALFISSGPKSTITRRMFTSLRDQVDPTIAAISTMLIVASVILLGTAALLQRKKR